MSRTAALRVVEPEPTDLSLDDLAETIHRAYATAGRRSMEASEQYLIVGRALVEARVRFPSDRLFGEWFGSQAFGFSQQRAWTLRTAAEQEAEVRDLLTSQLVSGRTPNIETAVEVLRKRPIGPPRCTGHEHVPHPYPSSGFLCLTEGADAAERIPWADELAASAAAHREAERQRPPGDGQVHDAPEGWRLPASIYAKSPTRSLESLRVDLAHLCALRDDYAERIAEVEAEIAALEAADA